MTNDALARVKAEVEQWQRTTYAPCPDPDDIAALVREVEAGREYTEALEQARSISAHSPTYDFFAMLNTLALRKGTYSAARKGTP